ncbi:MAG TPA: prepilin-type N-terminal cleavage/methylation domain-containing protein [Patescibacteria group bacterium]
MKRKDNKNLIPAGGFTLIELLVVTAITAIIAAVSISNFRAAENRKRVVLAIDGIVSSLSLAQSYTLAGKNTNNAQATCRSPQYYYITFTYTNTYTMYALDNCGQTDLIQSFTLPDNTQMSTSGLILDSVAASTNLRIAFYPPFAQIRSAIDIATNNTFSTAAITVQSLDGSESKTVTVDGVVGRISR